MNLVMSSFRFDPAAGFPTRSGMKALLPPGGPVLMVALSLLAPGLRAEVNKAEQIAPGVFFHEGDIGRKGHCNNGWIVLDDYVLVIDGNFPSGAQEVIPKIKSATDRPIRFAFDTQSCSPATPA